MGLFVVYVLVIYITWINELLYIKPIGAKGISKSLISSLHLPTPLRVTVNFHLQIGTYHLLIEKFCASGALATLRIS